MGTRQVCTCRMALPSRFLESGMRTWERENRSGSDRDRHHTDLHVPAREYGRRPPSPPPRGVFKLLDPIRRVASLGSRQPPRPVGIQVTSPEARSGQASPVLRSPSFPDFHSANGVVPGSPRLYNVNIVANGSVSSLTSRSRNSSRMDLSSLMPRPLSRASSIHDVRVMP